MGSLRPHHLSFVRQGTQWWHSASTQNALPGGYCATLCGTHRFCVSLSGHKGIQAVRLWLWSIRAAACCKKSPAHKKKSEEISWPRWVGCKIFQASGSWYRQQSSSLSTDIHYSSLFMTGPFHSIVWVQNSCVMSLGIKWHVVIVECIVPCPMGWHSIACGSPCIKGILKSSTAKLYAQA